MDHEGTTGIGTGAFRRRYGSGEDLPVNAFIETVLNHRSVRAYDPAPVDGTHLRAAIAAAQSAATSSNLQVWTVISVTDPARKRRLAALVGNQRHVETAPLLLVWLADLYRVGAIAASGEVYPEGLDYLEMFLTGAVDASLAAQNAALAFESMGYGTCYIGSMRSHPVEVAAELGLPRGVFAVFGMTVGREAAGTCAAVKPRLPQTVIHHAERYGTTVQETGIEAYVAVLNRFQAEQGMAALDWLDKCVARVATAGALKNRDKLRGYLERLGFKLK